MFLKRGMVFITLLALLVCVEPASADTPPPADFDRSGVVDFPDFLFFISAFGSREGQEKYEAKYDLNGNGEIAFDDFLIFVSSFGQEVNCLPVFTSASTFYVLENTRMVSTVIAKDDDSQDDIIGYAISGGANQNAFEVINQNQLYFKALPDFERSVADDNTYTVVVQVTSGKGKRTRTADQAITITVIDVKEAPGRPAAPTVSDPTLNSLTVSWEAPTNTGPDISDYDVQYRQTSDSDFISHPHIGTAQTTTITGLKSYTYYEVQIRARNDEGTGAWSASTTAVPRRLPPNLLTKTPWHLVDVHLVFSNEPKDIQSFCSTFTIEGPVPDNVNLYIASFSQQINQIRWYGGIQTVIDGHTDKNNLVPALFTHRNRGAIFSRWQERNVGAIRQAPGGLVASSGHEGDFISVRNDFAWSEGTYRLCLRKSDVVEGEPLPANYKPEDIAYVWGRYEHTWVRMEATDMSTNETTIIGELAFPGKTLSLNKRHGIFVEIYGRPNPFRVRKIPVFNLYFSHFQVDGNDQQYNSILEVSNPIPAYVFNPVMAQTSYLEDQGIIKIEVGRYTGEMGKIVKDVPLQTVRVSVCDRTNAVRDAIMAQVPVSTCGDVTAEHLSAISSLILNDANLTELKAGDLSGLTGLTTLSLQGNRLSSLPDGLFNDLTALTWLYLGDNQLTSSPSELFTLSNLTILYIWGNQLGGEIPAELFTLSNLTILDLGGNQLVGEIPPELGKLSNLTQLSLHSNQLVGEIPKALGNLSNLTVLSLHSNQLVGEIPVELGNLSNLISMYLGINQLGGEIPKELGNLSNLEVLWLQDNASLMGALPLNLSRLTKLRQFYFNNTGLCAPLDAAFQTWLQDIEDASGSNCSG
ncbi:MAG: hypothetical protein F4Y79_11960 [Gemmatimonadetes bacterium]|nr:hypothetical protein [Gemmatimonadota bacterium]